MNWKNYGYGSDESEDAGFDAMNEDTESFPTVEELAPSKKCKKEQAAVKQKSMSLKKVNQVEIMGPSSTLWEICQKFKIKV